MSEGVGRGVAAGATKDIALSKLTNVFGEARATELVARVCREIGIDAVRTPQDRLRFATQLMTYGGIYEAVGRAIKIQAILHGAKEG